MSLVKLVEVWRGSVLESVHFGAAAIANSNGEIIAGWGDPELVTYPRSALKPIQAIPLVESGAAAARNLGPEHVAFACASHRGEPLHRDLAEKWLLELGLEEAALACGPEYPADLPAAFAAARGALSKRRIYNNCSGKHCALLTVARHHGWPVEGYHRLDHSVQQLYLDALSELADCDARKLPFGVDGCSLPAAALSVGAFAKLIARFAGARAASPRRQSAITAIQDAMRSHPAYVSGSAEPGVMVTRVTQGRLIMKTGAEGFISVFAPGQGLGIALKVSDGEARARVPALIALMSAASLIDEQERRALAALAEPPVLDSNGAEVGRIRGCEPCLRSAASGGRAGSAGQPAAHPQ